MKRPIERIHQLVLEYRVPITALVVSAYMVKYAFSGIRPYPLVDPERPLGVAGVMLAASGVGLRSWAAGGLVKGRILAKSGAYALTRHPLYAGTFLIALGMAAVMADPWFLLVLMLLGAFVMAPKIRQEERINADRFGEDWATFRMNTTLFFPRRLRMELRAPWTGRQWLRNREYRALAATLLAFGILQALHHLLKD